MFKKDSRKMKVISTERIMRILSNLKEYLPSENGVRPRISLSSESIDYLIEKIQEKSIEIDINAIKKENHQND